MMTGPLWFMMWVLGWSKFRAYASILKYFLYERMSKICHKMRSWFAALVTAFISNMYSQMVRGLDSRTIKEFTIHSDITYACFITPPSPAMLKRILLNHGLSEHRVFLNFSSHFQTLTIRNKRYWWTWLNNGCWTIQRSWCILESLSKIKFKLPCKHLQHWRIIVLLLTQINRGSSEFISELNDTEDFEDPSRLKAQVSQDSNNTENYRADFNDSQQFLASKPSSYLYSSSNFDHLPLFLVQMNTQQSSLAHLGALVANLLLCYSLPGALNILILRDLHL